ncbi:MAG: glycerol-3-phosphate 1-O-acyltransferase PlsY [Chloroflexi bacterium]|nr:glycerol-3-phosphate 1-O-acyltransferase PlsY [Chloroflexota bacterium]
MTDYLIPIAVGYLFGSLPVGLIVGWAFKRVDIRDFGSGRTGMTNVLRTVGVPAAAVVLVLDMGKGAAAILVARLLGDSHGPEVAAALAAMVGHNWPVSIGFKGGRGTAPGWGGLCVLSPLAGLIAAAVSIPVVGATRYVSLGSIVGALAGVSAIVVIAATGHAPSEYIWFGAIAGTLVIVQHRDNIQRLLKGEERKLGRPAGAVKEPAGAARRKGLRWPRSA